MSAITVPINTKFYCSSLTLQVLIPARFRL